MGMSELQGKLADAIRDSHIINALKELEEYKQRDQEEYLEIRRDERLRGAELLALRMHRNSTKIIAAIQEIRTARKDQKKSAKPARTKKAP